MCCCVRGNVIIHLAFCLFSDAHFTVDMYVLMLIAYCVFL